MLQAPRRAPRTGCAHPRWGFILASTFSGLRVLSNFDRAPIFLFVFCACLVHSGARLGWVWLKALVLSEIEPRLDAFKPRTCWACPDLTGARFGFGFGSRPLVFFIWSLGWTPQSVQGLGWVGWRLRVFVYDGALAGDHQATWTRRVQGLIRVWLGARPQLEIAFS